MTFATTFTLDGSIPPLLRDLVQLRAGNTENIIVLIDGFLSTDTITSITLWAKVDPARPEQSTSYSPSRCAY